MEGRYLGRPQDNILNVGTPFYIPAFDSPLSPLEQAYFIGIVLTRFFFHRVREVDVPLYPSVHCPISAVHRSSLDANPMPMDTPSLPSSSSDSLAPPLTYNGQPPAILLSGQNFETTGSSSVLPDVRSSQVGLESPTNLPSSRITGVMDVPSSGMDHSFPSLQGNLQLGDDCDIATGGWATTFSMSGDPDNRQDEFIAELGLAGVDFNRHPDDSSPGVRPVADVTRVNGLTAPDRRSLPADVHAIQSAPGMIPSTESHRSEHRLSCSPLPPTWNSPEIHTSQVDTSPLSGHGPQSPALAHANLIPHLCQPVTTSEPTDSTTSCATSLCHGSQGLHHPPLPQPPPDITALLMAESSGDVLSPVFAHNSPLVPWELPSEIGHFWSGLFKISDIKVTRTCHMVRHLISPLSPGRNEFTTKLPEYTYSPACLAFLSGMGAWRRGSAPG